MNCNATCALLLLFLLSFTGLAQTRTITLGTTGTVNYTPSSGSEPPALSYTNIGHLSGSRSNIQDQIDLKASLTQLTTSSNALQSQIDGIESSGIATADGFGTNTTLVKPYVIPFTTLRVFGDSTSDESDEWAGLLEDDWGFTLDNKAVAGYFLIQMMDRAFTNTVSTNLTTVIQCCVNDSTETSAARVNTWSNAVPAAIAFHAIPDSKKIFANNANVATTGTWTTDSLWSGVGKVSTVNGSTLTFTNYGTVVYVATRQTNSGGAGTYTVSIDGVSQGTFQAGGAVYGSSAGASPRLLRFGDLDEGLHVVVLTVTSATSAANPVWFDWSAGNLGNDTDLGPRVWISTTTRRTATSYGALGGSEATVTRQNKTIRNTADQMAADGLNVGVIEFAAVVEPYSQTSDGTHPNGPGRLAMMAEAKSKLIGNRQPRDYRIASGVAAGGGGSDTPWTEDHDADDYSLTSLGSVAFSGDVPATGTIRLDNNSTIDWKDFTGVDRVFAELTGDNLLFWDGMIYMPPGNRIELRPNYLDYVLMARADGVLVTELVVGDAFLKTDAALAASTITVPTPSGTNITGQFLKLVGGASTGDAAGGSVDIEVTRPGGTSGTTIRNQTLAVRVADTGLVKNYPRTSASPIIFGGAIGGSIVSVGNVNTDVSTLITNNIPIGIMGASVDHVVLRANGKLASNTNGKQFVLSLNGTTVWDTGSLAFNDGDWTMNVEVFRSGPTSARAYVTWQCSNALLPHFVVAKISGLTTDWTTNIPILLTGTATASNDITCDTYTLKAFPAP